MSKRETTPAVLSNKGTRPKKDISSIEAITLNNFYIK